MGLSGLLPILVPFILLGGVQEPELVQGFFRRLCPRSRTKCEIQEINQCTKSRHCPQRMKCCKFNCAKKCLNLKEDICSLPKVAGPCLAYIPRWWYDRNTQMCFKFIYGGCQGNNNNFQSEYVCQDICQKKCEYSLDNHMLY
ncbi:WAP four-disulfide core domain protein 6A-like [Rousettus aegyptiacus]|uniref:WAP four-disulfide core domain protein 6A-like n=1 Tax=Rousettus aegyptiacus TaxID=9407 RepID=UPI00168D3345|nr:WAP four-disulfide core domain protein 6A-like [Rousettus aegyptiacus]